MVGVMPVADDSTASHRPSQRAGAQNAPSPSLLARTTLLRQRIQDLHAAVEATAIAQAMIAETVSVRGYVTLLRRLRPIHAAFDAQLPALPLDLPRAALRRTPDLDADLRFWDPACEPLALGLDPVFAALPPTGLIGALYVFEGSRLGSQVLLRHLGAAFAGIVDDISGLRYHRGDGAIPWSRCKQAIDDCPLDASQEEAVVAGALTTMGWLVDLYGTIRP
jgi:heme oxygenase